MNRVQPNFFDGAQRLEKDIDGYRQLAKLITAHVFGVTAYHEHVRVLSDSVWMVLYMYTRVVMLVELWISDINSEHCLKKR